MLGGTRGPPRCPRLFWGPVGMWRHTAGGVLTTFRWRDLSWTLGPRVLQSGRGVQLRGSHAAASDEGPATARAAGAAAAGRLEGVESPPPPARPPPRRNVSSASSWIFPG